jgi:ArsR family transcriptional regulator
MSVHPAELLKLLSDGTRLRSLMLLLHEKELCVCELTHATGEIQPKISRHLATLRNLGVVTVRRTGQWIYYQINPELPGWALDVLHAAFDGMKTDKKFTRDLHKLHTMPCRPVNKQCV